LSPRSVLVPCMFLMLGIIALPGCQTLTSGGTEAASEWAGGTQRGAVQTVSWVSEKVGLQSKEITQQRMRQRATQLYQQGDELFRKASSKSREQATSEFVIAASRFNDAAAAFPGSAIAQDALFMEGESNFFADRLGSAENAYAQCQKEFPQHPRSAQISRRRFAIAKYWLDASKADPLGWSPFNLTDRRLPGFDIDGNGIRVMDQIRFDDPTGNMADHATMAVAEEHYNAGRYLEADEFLRDLIEAFPDSEHQFNANIMSLRCKLENYSGPGYSDVLLDEADDIINRLRNAFPDKLVENKQQEAVATASAHVDYLRAEKLKVRGTMRDRQRNYQAAAMSYKKIIDNYPTTPFAKEAAERLKQIESLPARPRNYVAEAFQYVFPDRRKAKPLREVPYQQRVSPEGTLMR
ncbi:MAG: tetratricopeptide repeat protein, partial [Planctomycetota bacterium]